MNNTINSKWLIYSLIIIWFLWIFFVLNWIFNSETENSLNYEQDEIITTTNDILTTTESLPVVCWSTLSLLNCMISSPQLSWDKEWINQYYQKLISERNTITNNDSLEKECKQQYNYIQWLKESWYQEIIQSCIQ